MTDPPVMIVSSKPEPSKMALLYLIAREFNEDLNLDRLLRRVLIATARVVGTTNGSLFVLDDNEDFVQSLFLRGSVVRDAAEESAAHIILQKGLAGWVRENKEGVLVDDVNEDDRWYADENNPHLLPQRSAIAVPLLAGQKVIAILTLTHDNPGYFDRGDLTLLTDIADQATTAILNGRVHRLEQQRLKLSDMISEMSRQMNASLDLGKLLELILDQLAHLVGYNQCIIFLVDQGYLTVKIARGLDNLAEVRNLRVRLYRDDDTLPLVNEFVPLHIDDLQTQNTWFKDVTDIHSRSWIAAPLVSQDGLAGIISVARTVPFAYTEEDMYLVNTLASQAAIALHNASLLSQLQTEKSRYTRLFEESSDILLVMDLDGVILEANRKACQVLGQPKDVLIGSDLALLDHNLRKTFDRQKKELSQGKELTFELRFQSGFGRETPVEINAKRLDIRGDISIQWAGRDVTARYELERMKQDLTHMIVHDLRGPMGTMLGSLELLPFLIKANAPEEEIADALEMLQVARRTGKTLKDLVDSMLDLTKLEQGTFPLRLQPVNLAELLAEVIDQITPQADAKDIHILYDKLDDELLFDLDGSIIRRVLVNLIDNAIKYTPAGGRVETRVAWDDQMLRLKVIDNGPGIPKEHQQKVFDKFGRVDHQSKIQGVGLGLAFCKMAIEAHHGRIWLESEVGVGTTFLVEIPRNLAEQISL
jgi:PAS domain S-box-containing protein